MSAAISLIEHPGPDDREAIASGVRVFNERNVGDSHARPLAIALRDEEGRFVGGLWGRTSYGWLFVELLFVPEAMRGTGCGASLMDAAEREAKARGCHGAWLDTYDFQARGFYERLGYEQFGELTDYPKGHRRHFMRKNLG